MSKDDKEWAISKTIRLTQQQYDRLELTLEAVKKRNPLMDLTNLIRDALLGDLGVVLDSERAFLLNRPYVHIPDWLMKMMEVVQSLPEGDRDSVINALKAQAISLGVHVESGNNRVVNGNDRY